MMVGQLVVFIAAPCHNATTTTACTPPSPLKPARGRYTPFREERREEERDEKSAVSVEVAQVQMKLWRVGK